jgi:hypothetical protein
MYPSDDMRETLNPLYDAPSRGNPPLVQTGSP